jgi:hypothetical protein
MVKRPRVGKKIAKKVRSALNDVKDDIESIKVPDAVDEAIHDDIQNGKIEAAMAAAEEPAPAPKPAPKLKAAPKPNSIAKRTNDSGDDVVKLQEALGVTGEEKFGYATQVAVQHFQRQNGLTVTGIADAETQAKIYG